MRQRRRAGHTYGKLAPQAINSAAAAEGEATLAPPTSAMRATSRCGRPPSRASRVALAGVRRGADGQLGTGRPGVLLKC